MTNAKLFELLIHLDATRSQIEQLKADDKTATKQVVEEFRARRIDAFELLPGRRAVMDRPETTTVDFDRFRDFCIKHRVAASDYTAAIKQTVSIVTARQVLGQDQLDQISTKKKGNHRLRFVAVRNAD